MSGKLLASKEYDDASIVFDINKLTKGMFILKIFSEGNSVAYKKVQKI